MGLVIQRNNEVDGGDLISKKIHGWNLIFFKHMDCAFSMWWRLSLGKGKGIQGWRLNAPK